MIGSWIPFFFLDAPHRWPNGCGECWTGWNLRTHTKVTNWNGAISVANAFGLTFLEDRQDLPRAFPPSVRSLDGTLLPPNSTTRVGIQGYDWLYAIPCWFQLSQSLHRDAQWPCTITGPISDMGRGWWKADDLFLLIVFVKAQVLARKFL